MTIPLWVIVTIAYVLVLVGIVLYMGKAADYWDFGTPIIGCGVVLIATICYLGFWVIVLATT